MAAPRLGLTTSPKPPDHFPCCQWHLSHFGWEPLATFTLRSFELWAGFWAVIDWSNSLCPFPAWYHGFPVGFQHSFFCPQRHELKSATFGRLGSRDHLLPFHVQAGSLPGTCATDWRVPPLWRDCVMEITGKQWQSFRRSPRRLKDNSDDSSAFLISEASLAFPVSSFANIWAQKDSKRSRNELRVGVEMNAQSHQCNSIPLQLKLNLGQKDTPWVFINVWTIFISERTWKIWSFNTIFLLSSPDPSVAY